jgi:hypothetical protein
MSVYVDPLKDWGWRLGPSCHMTADTDDELHAMAAAIGMKRSWAQDMDQPSQAMHHYDLVASRRRRAVAKGAIEVSFREWAAHAMLDALDIEGDT